MDLEEDSMRENLVVLKMLDETWSSFDFIKEEIVRWKRAVKLGRRRG
jgi:hypothetical protein